METQLGPMWTEGERDAKSVSRTDDSKGLFLLLSSLSLLLLLAMLWLLFFLLEPRLSSLDGRVTTAVGLAFTLAGVMAAALAGSELLSAASGVILLPRFLSRNCATRFLLPLSEKLGGLMGISADRVKGAFLEFNNALIAAGALRVLPGRVLVLLPHCLQKSDCPQNLEGDIRNCADCGACAVSELKQLLSQCSVHSRIVGGGRFALQTVKEFNPDAIVGVACERELVAAVREMKRVPVLAVTNWRPEGPCRNTRVVIEKVEDALRILLKDSKSECTMH
ncbi:MAG: DUF116 domain-containing protein [Candidatus Eiseniibacteriota bacterium]|nr:MAG: DUF116 domain-containing protein [Candidatus Eisenbacteria bacterium]